MLFLINTAREKYRHSCAQYAAFYAVDNSGEKQNIR